MRPDCVYCVGRSRQERLGLAQAIGQAAIVQGYKVLYREAHVLLEELGDAVAEPTKGVHEEIATVPFLITDDFGAGAFPAHPPYRPVATGAVPVRVPQCSSINSPVEFGFQ
jgi:hypothetical protein